MEEYVKLNPNITVLNNYHRYFHSKASEEYIDVVFQYPDLKKSFEYRIPVEYRRTGVSLKSESDINRYLNCIYEQLNPCNHSDWIKEQGDFWAKRKAVTTKSFFDSLIKGGWQCTVCTLPSNPNFARRIQDLKEMGYTLTTDTNRFCATCNKNTTHLCLIPIQRSNIEGNGYETWSPKLRERILKVLNGIDVYENKKKSHLLPDHKFPEIRWNETTKSENPNTMTDDEIKKKFQLINNQRNQEKREACRTCFQTSKRGEIYGIPYYSKGTALWDDSIPLKGVEAEKGCIGCPWYDIEAWRNDLIKVIKQNN